MNFDISNGKEKIEWIVLEKDGNKALVTSRFLLDWKMYNETRESMTWENCSLRKWLNDSFYNASFSGSEKSNIVTSTIVNADHPTYGTDGGNSTNDKVFLLSRDEANTYFSSNKHRNVWPTKYVAAQHADDIYSTDGNGEWWLRSPGGTARYASHIYFLGSISEKYVDFACGVRPAMWINI